MENIETECKHILHLLNNLLDVYRLNESKETCNNVPFNLNDLLERIVTGFSHIANNKGIIFHHDSQNTDVVLCGDMDRISQIIDNLLTNAVKFTNAGMIQFNVRYENGMLYIEIRIRESVWIKTPFRVSSVRLNACRLRRMPKVSGWACPSQKDWSNF